MKRIFIIFAVLLAGCCGIYLLNSCVKKDFDAPPDESSYDPGLTVTHTISELLTIPYGTAINDEVVIQGIVVMDDKSGNYYKSIVIEDSTGGIQVLLDQNSLYNDYPVGRKVYVKCKGLYLGANNGTPQLGNIPDNTGGVSNIPFNLISDHLVKANYPNAIVPDTFTITQLKNAGSQYVNRLVAIKDIEFVEEALDSTYAQPASLGSATNHTLEDCSGTVLTLRTSGYASFQPVNLPGDRGFIVGLYTQYISPYNQTSVTPQLYIRDTGDVHFTEERCNGTDAPQYLFNDGFTSLVNWTPVSISGSQAWGIDATHGHPGGCAKMSGYSGSNYDNEDWLISKNIDLSGYNTITFSFETAKNYSGNSLACFISTNYSDGNPNNATWTPVTATFSPGSWDWTSSGDIDLSSYSGQQIKLAFKYTSTTSAAATWEVDNVKVIGEQ